MSIINKVIIIALFLIPLVSAQIEVTQKVENYNNYSNLELNVIVKSEIEIIPEKNRYDIDFIDINLKYSPEEDERQKIVSQDINANGAKVRKDDDKISIRWDEPKEKNYSYSVYTLVKTENDFKKISKKIPFPLRNVDQSLEKFTKETEFIDSNEDIKDLSRKLAEGEDDLYVVVFKIADWVNNNIEYDLSTLTADVVQKSSWVLENKQGVCDELTNLFISMLRSLNIPARFVGGVTYTNTGYYFGNHGWAEVYFPGYGWVPFDVTFGQYGRIDPSHVKLSSVQDSGESAVDYTWRSSGITLKPKGLAVEASLNNANGAIAENAILEIKPLNGEAKFGSYVPLEIKVKNPTPYYLPLSVIISKSPKLLESNVKEILLNPKEEKKLFWTMEIDNNLDKRFVYTAELEATTTFGSIASNVIKFSKGFEELSLEAAKETIKKLGDREEKKLFAEIKLDCESEKNEYYSDEEIQIRCILENVGNKNLEDLNLCAITNCQNINLSIAEKKDFKFNLSLESSIDLRISAETNDLIKYDELKLKIVKVPKIRFIEVEPKSIGYNEIANVTFDIFSNAMINNVTLEIDNVIATNLENFEGRYNILVPVKGKQINNGVLTLKLFYKDELGLDRKHEEKHKIEITDIPIYKRAINRIINKINSS
ncbi:transglutaminase domain-containing protein [Candidatus Woesearchaeota archaeon]|nr:transglutaminase domain-containing protein [Candidatus Woesearchaeota archaeon]